MVSQFGTFSEMLNQNSGLTRCETTDFVCDY